MSKEALKILIVEDSESLNELISINLKRDGFDVHGVLNGKDAVSWVKKNKDCLILLDYKLPDLSADEVIDQIKKEVGYINFIIMTGYGDERVAVNLMKKGAKDYIIKDEKFIHLVSTVVLRVKNEIEKENELKMVKEELENKNALLDSVISHIPNYIFWKDTNSVYQGCNNSFAALIGLDDPEDVMGKTDKDLGLSKKEVKIFKGYDKEVLDNESAVIDVQEAFLKKNDTKISLLTNRIPLKDKDGKVAGVLGVCTDLSELRDIDESLNEKESRYRELFNHISSGVVILKTEDEGENFIIIDLNNSAEKIKQVKRINMIGRNFIDLFPDAVEKGLFDLIRKTSLTSNYEKFLLKTVEDDLLISFYEIYVYKLPNKEIVLVFDDMTEEKNFNEEQRKMTEALMEAYQINNDLVQFNPLGIFIYEFVEPDQFIIISGNSAAEKMIGIKLKEWIGKEFNEIWRNIAEESINQKYKKVMETGKPCYIENISYVDNNINRAFRINAFKLPSNKLVAAFEDITEQKRVEDELRKSESNLLLAQSIAKIGHWDWDVVSGELKWSNELYKIFGIISNKTKITINDFWDAIHPDDKDIVKQSTDNSIKKGAPYDIQYRIILPDKSEKYIHSIVKINKSNDGKFIHMHGTAQDITKLKELENTVLKNSMLLVSVIEGTNDVIFVRDLNAKYLLMNSMAAKVLGYANKDMIDNGTIFDVFPSELAEKIKEDDDAVIKSKVTLLVEEHIPVDGEMRTFLTTKAPYYDVDGKVIGVLGIGKDITERKEAEEKLLESESRLATVFKAAPIGLGVSVNSLITQVNDKFCELSGYKKEELIGKETRRLYMSDNDYMDIEKYAYLQIKEKDFGEIETRLKKKNGEIVDVILSLASFDPNDLSLGITFTARDITERKKAEEEIKRLAEFPSQNPNPVMRISRDNIVTYANKASNEFLVSIGCTLNEMLPKDLVNIVETCRKSDMYIRYEYIYSDNNYILLVFAKIDNDEVNIYGLDITDLKAAENVIKNLNEELEDRVRFRTSQLEEANKELESFAYSVSHDLRAPLRHIYGFTELLKTSIKDNLNEKTERYFNNIITASNKMGILIDDLLSFSRMSRNKMNYSEIDLNKLINEAKDLLHHEMDGRDIKWIIKDFPMMNGDLSMIRQVITNLISNAVKYSRNNRNTLIEIGKIEDIDDITVYVKDNGVGFDMKYVDRLFGVFQRLHLESDFEGTGIGLALVKRIIKRHGGKVWAEGDVGKGATFYITLPK